MDPLFNTRKSLSPPKIAKIVIKVEYLRGQGESPNLQQEMKSEIFLQFNSGVDCVD